MTDDRWLILALVGICAYTVAGTYLGMRIVRWSERSNGDTAAWFRSLPRWRQTTLLYVLCLPWPVTLALYGLGWMGILLLVYVVAPVIAAGVSVFFRGWSNYQIWKHHREEGKQRLVL